MHKKGSIRRNVKGEEFYFEGLKWKPFPIDTYDGETRFRDSFPIRIKIHWKTHTVFILVRRNDMEYLFKKKRFNLVWVRRHVFLFRLLNGKFLLTCGTSVYLLTLEEPIERFFCCSNFNNIETIVIFTKDHVYLFDRYWKKIWRHGLEKTMKEENILDPFFILEELPYKLHFLPFETEKLTFQPNWVEKMKRSLPQFSRTTSISGTVFFLEPNLHCKFFEQTKHLPEILINWINTEVKDISCWKKYGGSKKARHFFLINNEDIKGYLLCFECFLQGGTSFEVKISHLFSGWKDQWTFLIEEFLERHFLNVCPFQI